ncbi:MAG: SGNH/GDSL hydrolase family protein, partial [Oscillospiraceae bacterium]|nr:SGNH/GDSL hydrolase family protein [Oscillospiraceae bacterium]
KSFSLGKGEKCIKIILPGTVKAELSFLELSDASYIDPLKFKKKALIYGDSITQGFDALNPSRVYSLKLCDYLDADGINKAVGGAIYEPALAKAGEAFEVDYVFGAYGINDWARQIDKDSFKDNCRRFWEELCKKYPSAKKFLITPIWAKIWEDEKAMGKLSDVHKLIEDSVSSLSGIEIIDGWELVPHDKNLFGDENIHPNSLGFDEYYKNLIKKL